MLACCIGRQALQCNHYVYNYALVRACQLEFTMVPSLMNPVSLLGALLVSEGLLTHAQLIACLMIQKEEAAHLPLGQITVH